MDQAKALQLATALLSRAWSGQSMIAGVSNMLSVKQENDSLPDDPAELEQYIKERSSVLSGPAKGECGSSSSGVQFAWVMTAYQELEMQMAQGATAPPSPGDTLPATAEELASAGRSTTSGPLTSVASPSSLPTEASTPPQQASLEFQIWGLLGLAYVRIGSLCAIYTKLPPIQDDAFQLATTDSYFTISDDEGDDESLRAETRHTFTVFVSLLDNILKSYTLGYGNGSESVAFDCAYDPQEGEDPKSNDHTPGEKEQLTALPAHHWQDCFFAATYGRFLKSCYFAWACAS